MSTEPEDQNYERENRPMTNNPTIDGVSRELLERVAYRLSDLRQCDLSEAIFAILSSPFKCSFCDDKKSVCVDWDAGEWMSCPRCSPAEVDAPAAERQEPAVYAWVWLELLDGEEVHDGISFGPNKPDFKSRNGTTFEYAPLYTGKDVAAQQSTIARLEARITQLESEKELMLRGAEVYKERIAELESGRGVVVAWMTRCIKGAREGLIEQADGPDDVSNLEYWSRAFPVYSAPPAPAAVVPTTEQFCEAFVSSGYVDEAQAEDLAAIAAMACLDATAALYGVKS